jgi:hypothetical protein
LSVHCGLFRVKHVTHSGGCLCGAVRYEIHGPLRDVVLCHCRDCRIYGSLATVGVARSRLHFLSSTTLQSFESSLRARRWFCSRCGTGIYWDPHGEDFVAVWAGTIDQPTHLKVAAHIYVAQKPDYYEIIDGLPRFRGPMYADEDDAELGEMCTQVRVQTRSRRELATKSV